VLAEPNRRRILDLLGASEFPVGELVHQLNLSQPAVSKHLRILREAGLVEVRVDAQRRLYRVLPEPLQAIA
jgi:DNA-binding transcriptional ArsR family regulator